MLEHEGTNNRDWEIPRRKMSEAGTLTKKDHEPELTEIRIKGHLADRWTGWFDGLTITLTENGNTILIGSVSD